MKKLTAILTAAVLMLAMLAGCGTQAPAESTADEVELVVFAAASLKETLTTLGDSYRKANPGVKLTFNFDSSGTLKTQIEEGAECDIFLSAGQKQMNALDKEKEGSDFVLEGTRFNILENKVVLAVPDGNPAGLEGFDDLAARLGDGSVMLALGNSDVPVGQYTLKIFAYYGLDEAAMQQTESLTYCSNVKEVTTQVKEAAVDCGVIYQTDAFSAGLTVLDTATSEMCGQVIYPAAVMNVTKHEAEAKAFLDFLTGEQANAEFEQVGFTPLSR